MRLIRIPCFVLAALTFGATYPNGFSEVQVVTGLSSPTAMAFAPDGRLFVCQQNGALRVIKNETLLADPFLTFAVDANGERGLLGIAFDPNFVNNNFLYIYYTVPTAPIHNRVSRVTASGDVMVAGSEVAIMDLDNLSTATNHNGGALHFGLDGKLYVAVGENANGNNSQSFNNRLGKILRVNANSSVPGDNPFLGQTTGLNRAIWAMGLRNPFTFTFHPTNTRMHINDVGQNTWEEVNLGTAGANYGWPMFEGFDGSDPNFVDPLIAYNHSTGTPTGCAITGGAFYTGTKYPVEYADNYFYADFCGQWIYRLMPPSYDTQTAFGTILGKSAVDLQVWNGDLYYLTRDTGSVFRLDFSASAAPVVTTQPANQTVSLGQTATFTVAATGTSPLTYQWQRNGAAIAGAPNSPSYTTPPATLADNGAQFRCVLSNSFGSATSNAAVLTVVGNQPPTATIDTPAQGTLYTFNQSISFTGSGTDVEEGTLPASAFTWQIDFHHDSHTHPFLPPTRGVKSGSFQTNFAETSPNVFYRIILTVVDSAGASTMTVRDISPRTATVRLQSNPGGLQFKLDGIPAISIFSFTGVVGQPRTIEAVSPQTMGSRTYFWQSWSDNGAQAHTIATPPSATTFTARFRRQ